MIFIIELILAALFVTFVFLQRVWAGFTYFALAFGCLLGLLITIVWIVDFFTDYSRKGLRERYRIYCATLVNKSALTLDLIQKNDKLYYKKFKRTLIKEKCFAWLKIFLALGITISLFVIFLR